MNYINPGKAGFSGKDSLRKYAEDSWSGANCYKKGGKVKDMTMKGTCMKANGGIVPNYKENLVLPKGKEKEAMGYAWGGAAKIRLGQSTASGKQKKK